MCGIVGTLNLALNEEHLKLISHRGPDAQAIKHFNIAGNEIYFGHTRLTILDLTEAGSQPMMSNCGNYALIFNGEIYNHTDLKNDVPNFRYRGHSDTETILNHISKFGTESFKKFNGIFSLAFLDIPKKKLYLVRDHFGVKPLYYSTYDNKLAFASELRPILELMPDAEVSMESLYSFMKLRYNPSPQTLFKNIHKLEAGHYIEIDLESGHFGKPIFYSYLPEKGENGSKKRILEEYDERLHAAIKRQLQSDVPISILLSGGVDSGLLAYIATKVSDEKFSSYTAGYKMQTDSNEIEEAKITSDFVGTKHQPVYLNENDFLDNLAHFIKIVEEPLASPSLVPMYYLSKKIHEDGFKVVLSGQGVDEPWAGYAKYNFQTLFDKAPNELLSKFSFLKSSFKQDKMRRGLNSIMESDRLLRFIETCSVFDSKFLGNVLNQNHHEQHDQSVEKLFKYWFDLLKLNKFEAVDALMFFDTRTNLSDALLMYTDKISMHHALEVRVPFLDVELVRFVESLPYSYKVDMFKNKKLHKKLAEKHLPESIIYRKKKHFQLPIKEWFAGETGRKLESMMMNDKGMFTDIFNKKYIQRLFTDHRKGTVNFEKQLFTLVCMFYWLKIFVDKKEKELAAFS